MKLTHETMLGLGLFVLIAGVMLYTPVGLLLMEEDKLAYAKKESSLKKYRHTFKALTITNVVISTLWLVNEYAIKKSKNMFLAVVMAFDILIAGGIIGLLFALDKHEELDDNKKYHDSLKTLSALKIAAFAALCGIIVIHPSLVCLN